MGIWPVSRSTQWVSVSFLTPRRFFRKPRWRTCARMVTEESYVSEKVAHTWHPYRPAVKAKTWKSHNMACFHTLGVIPLLEPVLQTRYREPQVVCHLLSCRVHASITSKNEFQGICIQWQVPEVCRHEVGIAEVFMLKKTMTFVVAPATFLLLPNWMENSTNAFTKPALTTRMFALFLNIPKKKNARHATPNQQCKTQRTRPEATWGIRILVVWNKASREQLITNNPSWLERIKQDLSPAAFYSL